MPNQLVSRIKNKDKIALSKAITLIENRLPNYESILSDSFSHRKTVQKIGITGPPGAGKSTITNQLCKDFLTENKSIAVICVDPSSPFNGGAILGDRIRMKDINLSKDVFIRSIASRGNSGGLADCIADIDILLETFGFDLIIYETVGVGQIELDVINYCDTVVLAITPESGDDIQMMKAGLIECANIIVINKSDRPGASKLNTLLAQYLDIGDRKQWVSVLNLIATKNEGIDLLKNKVIEHFSFLIDKKIKKKKDDDRYRSIIYSMVQKKLSENFLTDKRLNLIKKETSKDPSSRISPYKFFDKIK